ncbi:MAG: signal transduction protein, partial [Moorea sp. SIO3C2]|nr:signal transduction protein [Moorena sp. SIO3C2]
PLLDGLDEVKAEYRDDCIVALNQFQQEYGAELVVCSRIKDYEALSNRLNFQKAVYIRLLTLEQIYHYLDSVGDG